jgi:hypothetical protein
MEQAFRADFSGIKIHTDSEADRLNKSIQAKAFTTQKDIFFKSGEYNPDTSSGQQLIAHELTHTIQQNSALTKKFQTNRQDSDIVQCDKKDFEQKRKNLENFFSGGQEQNLPQNNPDSHSTAEKKTSDTSVKKVPPLKKGKPWKIKDYYKMGANLGNRFKGSELIDLSKFVEGVKPVAEEKDNPNYFDNFLNVTQVISDYGGKGTDLTLGLVKTLGATSVSTIKSILAPVSDSIGFLINSVKTIVDVFRKDSKKFWEDGWETLKSTFNTIASTTTSVLELIGKFEAVVPIVGGIAKGISAIVAFVEAVKGAIEQIAKTAKNNLLRSKIEESKMQASQDQKSEDNKTQKERLEYYYSINQKRDRNIARQFIDKCSGILAAGVKLASGLVSIIGGVALLTGVGATVTAVLDCFTLGLDAFEFVINIVGKLFVYLPKVGHAVRQLGRDIAAKENIFGKVFRGLGFNAQKSSASKEKERKQVVGGLIDSASKIKTEFVYSGNDSTEVPDELKPEIPKYEGLDFELDAIGVDKKELYKLNSEASLGKRLKGQIGLIFKALKER